MGSNQSQQQQQPQAPPVKTINDMSKDELKAAQKEMKKEVSRGQREIDREIFKMDQLRKKAMQDLEKEVKKGTKADKNVKAMLAKNLVRVDKQKTQYMSQKMKLQDVGFTLDNYFAQVRMGQVMGKSTEVMKSMNQLINIPEMQKNMMEMQREMEKMGIIDEMMQETMEVNDDVDVDDEVEKMINEVEKDVIAKNPGLKEEITQQNPMMMNAQPQQQQQEDDFADRLNALKE